MIRVSFTKFLEFTAQTGEPKAETAITAWRQSNTPYDPQRDYHRRVRSAIVDTERGGLQRDWAAFVLAQNQKKRANYQDTIDKYYRWKGSMGPATWFDPPRNDWRSDEFFVTINPELGLTFRGERHAIKLFLNANRLSTLKAQVAGLMMHQALSVGNPGLRLSIFDVKAETLHTFSTPTERLQYLLIGEAAHMSAIIRAIRQAG